MSTLRLTYGLRSPQDDEPFYAARLEPFSPRQTADHQRQLSTTSMAAARAEKRAKASVTYTHVQFKISTHGEAGGGLIRKALKGARKGSPGYCKKYI